MHEPRLTVTGHVATEPELRSVADALSVTDFRLAATPRVRGADGAWRNGETLWFTVTAWRGLAENVSASLRTGDRVVVEGRLTGRTWLAGDERRLNLEIEAASVGLELSRGTASYVKPPRLVSDVDPLVSSGQVDAATGEVRMVPALPPAASGPSGPAPAEDDGGAGERDAPALAS